MTAISTIIKLAIVIIVFAILAIALYFFGFKYFTESKKREDCLNEVRKICTDCQLIGVPLNGCKNSLTGDYWVCRDILNEREENISDCGKYIGKWK
jgi:membrane protein implicated in regulation of membrane protease activity